MGRLEIQSIVDSTRQESPATVRPSVRPGLEVIVFQLDGQHYGLSIENVVEVLRSVASLPLPQAPAVVEGVIDLRGKIIPVLDVRARFRLKARPAAPADHLIVARTSQRTVAIRVDAASDVLSIQPAEMQEASQVSPGVGYITQLARWSNSIILIHDLATFLSSAESAELDRAMLAAGREGSP